MKKKLELKTILITALLIVGLALFILGNKNSYCLGFGAIFLGIACFLYAYEKIRQIDLQYRKLSEEYYSYEGEDIVYLAECQKQLRTFKKQSFRTKIAFYGFSILIVIVGFVAIF